MQSTIRLALFLALPSFLSLPAAAQWVKLPTAGAPRTADGKPNLAAPAPKTADGKPDLSGMWVPRDAFGCNLSAGTPCIELPIPMQAVTFAQGLKGGLPYQKWAADLVQARRKDAGFIDPHTHCMPPNFPRAWAFPESEKILQTPTEIAILHEFNASYRQIFLDGRKLPEDPLPTWNGYSTAHWDGNTLVVESTGYHDDSWLDTTGNFFSSGAHLTERITRPTFGTLDVEVTVDDPKVFTSAWTVAVHMKAMVDTEMLDFYCQDNNKDLDHFVK